MDQMTIYIILAGVFGLFMAWGIGANDVANAMATSVGSRALTVKKAIIIAAIFEFAGAYLAGGQVTKTIRKGIIEADVFCVGCEASPDILVYGMLASLLAAATWLLIASRNGWPVSTTHTIVGAVVGFAMAGIGIDAVNWGKISQIVASWVVSPLLGGTVARRRRWRAVTSPRRSARTSSIPAQSLTIRKFWCLGCWPPFWPPPSGS